MYNFFSFESLTDLWSDLRVTQHPAQRLLKPPVHTDRPCVLQSEEKPWTSPAVAISWLCMTGMDLKVEPVLCGWGCGGAHFSRYGEKSEIEDVRGISMATELMSCSLLLAASLQFEMRPHAVVAFRREGQSEHKVLHCKSVSLYPLLLLSSTLSPASCCCLILFVFIPFFHSLIDSLVLLLMSLSLELSSSVAMHSKLGVLKEMDAHCPQ